MQVTLFSHLFTEASPASMLRETRSEMHNIFFKYQSISIIMINVKSLFISNVKPDFCSQEKVVETRPLIFLNKINI